MLKKIFLPVILIFLGYGLWVSPNFEEIAAGVAVFLFGMIFLEEGFKKFSGGFLENFLKKSTDRLYKSILFGITTTTLMQSSSLVSLITISFLGAGLIGLAEGIGIIFGSNIGTTTGAWLIAGFGLKVKLSAFAMPILVFGIVLVFQKSKALKGIGYVLSGLGFLFLGIHYMKEGFESFKDAIDLSVYGVEGIKGLFIYTGLGIAATSIMQSSHATLVLTITALAAGQISYENALALAIGANIGTTITAILGAMGSNIDGKRLAGAHLIFNITTGLIAIVFIHQFIWAVEQTSGFIGIAKEDYALKLAVFHTFFNVVGVMVMVPFMHKLVLFLKRTLRPVLSDMELPDRAKFLNDSALEFPDTATESLLKETKRLYKHALGIIAKGLNFKKADIFSEEDLDTIVNTPKEFVWIDIDAMYRKKIKEIYGDIIDFSTKAQANMPSEHIETLYKIKLANRSIVEAVKGIKHLQKNMKKYLISKNSHVKSEYNNIRKVLGELLRLIEEIKNADEHTVVVLLSKAKVLIRQSDIVLNGTLDNLIRNHYITNEMATSLMNDSTYVTEIGNNLIEMADTTFIKHESVSKEIKQDMKITDEELQQLLQ